MLCIKLCFIYEFYTDKLSFVLNATFDLVKQKCFKLV